MPTWGLWQSQARGLWWSLLGTIVVLMRTTVISMDGGRTGISLGYRWESCTSRAACILDVSSNHLFLFQRAESKRYVKQQSFMADCPLDPVQGESKQFVPNSSTWLFQEHGCQSQIQKQRKPDCHLSSLRLKVNICHSCERHGWPLRAVHSMPHDAKVHWANHLLVDCAFWIKTAWGLSTSVCRKVNRQKPSQSLLRTNSAHFTNVCPRQDTGQISVTTSSWPSEHGNHVELERNNASFHRVSERALSFNFGSK